MYYRDITLNATMVSKLWRKKTLGAPISMALGARTCRFGHQVHALVHAKVEKGGRM